MQSYRFHYYGYFKEEQMETKNYVATKLLKSLNDKQFHPLYVLKPNITIQFLYG